eukprot:529063_1
MTQSEHEQDLIIEGLEKICSDIFIGNLEQYLNTKKRKIPWDDSIVKLLHDVVVLKENRSQIVDIFYSISGFDKNVFYNVDINKKCDKTLKRIIEDWADLDEPIIEDQSGDELRMDKWHTLSTEDKIQQLTNIFKTKSVFEIHLQTLHQQVKSLFVTQVVDQLQLELQQNQTSYIENENGKRFEFYAQKANTVCSTNSIKRLKAVWYHGMNQDHGISVGDVMNKDHVIALMCYAHCSELCTEFRETYRQKPKETLPEQKKRHSTYGNMGKLLYQSFIFFASRDSKVQILYHGMGVQLLFPTLYCTFKAPTSTTTASSVALGFGNDRGVVVMFESSDSTEFIRSLNMSLFTCFDHEEEHLIFETRLHIRNIFVPKETVWIGKSWMKQLSLFDLLTHGHDIKNKYFTTQKNQKKLCKNLKKIMNDDNSSISPSVYLNSLINAVTMENKKIWLNLSQIQKLIPELQKLFLDDNSQFGVFIKYLTNKAVRVCPIFMSRWILSDDTFDFVERVTKKYDDIRIYGSPVTFIMPNSKQISFRPQLTMVHDLFDIQMQLIDTSDVEQIQIHFNVSCNELNGFYTSLHPRWMDVARHNAFDVTLPPRSAKSMDTNSISIEMSCMLHNFDQFGIDYNDFSSTFEPITQEIIQTTKSYRCADILSAIYGISNGVMSVFDSVSDVLFVLFLSFMSYTPQSKTILALTIGNLVSVAIIISLYMSQRIKSSNKMTKIVFFCILLLVSPVLPSIEWILKKCQKHEREILEVEPNSDGILLWFKQELIRNRIFLFEAIFESCFQILIQFIAIFEFDQIEQDIYLYLSIAISLSVILSKFILMSYNLKRRIIGFNMYCYFMDII